MDKIKFSDLKNEVKKFVKEKNDIIELENKMKEIEKDVNERKEELNSFSYIEIGLYKDLTEEIESKENEAKEISKEINDRKTNLKKDIETKKEEIIGNLNSQLEIADESLDEIKEEKEALEEKVKLNDVTKEQFIEMDSQQQQEVRNAKERYLINKKTLNEVSPKFEFLEFLMGEEAEDRCLEINTLINSVDSKFNYDNIEKIFKETIEFEKTLNTINSVETEKTSNIVESKGKINRENETTEAHKVKTKKLVHKRKRVREDSIEEENLGNKIQEIFIDEYKNRVEIIIGNNKKPKIVDGNISKILSNRKQIFKDNNISDKCAKFLKSKMKRFLLKRKLNPAIVKALGDNNEPEAIEEYIKSVYLGEHTEFKLIHDLRQTSLTGFKKMMMSRFAKVEENNLNAEVFRDRKHIKLLADKKVENKLYMGEKTLSEKIKVDNETLQTLNSISEKANDGIKVNDNIENNSGENEI